MALRPFTANDLFDFDDAFDWSLPSRRSLTALAPPRQWAPEVDISETDKQIELDMNAPGFNKGDISVDLQNNVLCIKGKHSDKKKEDKGKYHRRERRSQSFERRFTLPEYADVNAVKAKMENGVLHLSIDKKESAKAAEQTKSINIS